jgi:hypothetical protein
MKQGSFKFAEPKLTYADIRALTEEVCEGCKGIVDCPRRKYCETWQKAVAEWSKSQ